MAIPDRIVWEMRLTLCQEEKYMGLVIRQQTLLCEVNGAGDFSGGGENGQMADFF